MNEIDIIFNKLYGQKCWRAWRGYSTAIFFEFGKKIITSKTKQLERGSYTLSLDFCPWKILENGKEIGNDDQDYRKIDSLLPKFENQTIEKINIFPDSSETQIIFSNNLIIQTFHQKLDKKWYLLTPEKILTVEQNCLIKIKD